MDWPVRFDEQTAKDLIGIYLLQNPSVSQAEIAREYGVAPGLFSRFLRLDNVKVKPEWVEIAYQLSLKIDVERLRECYEDVYSSSIMYQKFAFGGDVENYLVKTYDVDDLIVIDGSQSEGNRFTAHDRVAVSVKRDESSDEEWLIRSFLRCDSSIADIAMQLTVNCSAPGKLHIIISIDDKRMLDELQSSFDKQKSAFTADILSVTYLLFDKSSRNVTYEYTDGDLGLKKRSEQGSGMNIAPSIAPQ